MTATRRRGNLRRRPAAVILAASAALAGCTGADPDAGDRQRVGGPEVRTAERVTQMTSPHEATGMTLLESPMLAADGALYVADVAAPAGAPKVLRLDPETGGTSPVFTDGTSAVTSVQASPADGRLYLTDFAGGGIISIDEDGGSPQVFHAGEVDGSRMHPDDIAFDADGNLFVTDSSGYADPYWEASGRVVRFDHGTAEPTVLADRLPAPNGITLDPGGSKLWVTHNTANRVDLLTLDGEGTGVVSAHPAVHVSAGKAQVDSAAVDADGNLYVGLHNRPAVLVYNDLGEQIAVIEVPAGDEGLASATNFVIEPGTRQAYMTVSGEAGGFVYEFEALADGLP